MKVRFLLLMCLLANAVHAQVGGRVTVGTFAMRPASCTAGDLYVASDTNLIYQCGPANAWTNAVNKYGIADAYRYVSSLGSDSKRWVVAGNGIRHAPEMQHGGGGVRRWDVRCKDALHLHDNHGD